MQRIDFHVAELDCAEEVIVLRRQLEKKEGVQNLDFDVMRAKMLVTYDEALISPAELQQAAAATGMHVSLWDEQPQPRDGGGHGRPRPQYRRMALTLISGVLLLAAFVTQWVTSGSLSEALGRHAGALAYPSWPAAVLYLISIATALWLVGPKAWLALRRLRPDMNLLMCLAVFGAVAIGQWFEAATVSFLFALALFLEQWSVGRARHAIAALMDLTPPEARCVGDEGEEELRGIESVPPGTRILIRPGERIPLDGRVETGTSLVDQAPITGESAGVEKQAGDEVFAGTINGDGALRVVTTRRANDTTLARIMHMVEEAQARRAESEQWVERFARYYTPGMVALSITVALSLPWLTTATWIEAVYNGLVILVIACPCALVISTPVSIVSALTAAARHGVLIKGGRYLEACADLPAMALDKTGTLTTGQPQVVGFEAVAGADRRSVGAHAGRIERHSGHPAALAIVDYVQRQGWFGNGDSDHQDANYQNLSGRGAEGSFSDGRWWVGSLRLARERLGEEGVRQAEQLLASHNGEAATVVAVGDQRQLRGLFYLTDLVRPEARDLVRNLKQQGVKHVLLLTGDHTSVAQEVAKQTGVDQLVAEALPEDKVRRIQQLRQQYRRVGMVGDGVNDSPAMAHADVSIAMGTIGTDVAIETADVTLMADDLNRIPWLLSHARRTLRIIRQNIGFALGLKALFLVLALAGLATLWMAIAADMGASLLVIFNGLRLLRD